MAPPDSPFVDFTSFSNIVAGEPRGSSAQCFGTNPSTKEQLWAAPVASVQDIEDAISSAKTAFPAWANTTVVHRKECLKRFRELFAQHSDDVAHLLTTEGGKPHTLASFEVKIALEYFDHHISLDIEEEKEEVNGKILTTRHVPLGTVAAICPWNFPVVLSLGKILPALLTGNCVIVKPSPFSPYTVLKLVDMARSIFPAGVLQVLGGDDSVGPALVAHPDVHKISFTGSIGTGKKIMTEAAKTMKRLTLELGGNDPTIILPDVDVEKVAPKVVQGAFMNSAQMCVATKRVYVHESIYGAFLQAMVKALQSYPVGDAAAKTTVLGPIQNEMQYEHVKGLVEDSKNQGYKFATGKTSVEPAAGFFIQPTLIDNPPDEARVVAEEPFGPILPILKWSTEDEVIRRANNSKTGLGGTVWSADPAHAERIARQLEIGSVWINSFEMPIAQAYFSGHKESGFGGEWGKDGWKAYCNVQVIHAFKSKM